MLSPLPGVSITPHSPQLLREVAVAQPGSGSKAHIPTPAPLPASAEPQELELAFEGSAEVRTAPFCRGFVCFRCWLQEFSLLTFFKLHILSDFCDFVHICCTSVKCLLKLKKLPQVS